MDARKVPIRKERDSVKKNGIFNNAMNGVERMEALSTDLLGVVPMAPGASQHRQGSGQHVHH